MTKRERTHEPVKITKRVVDAAKPAGSEYVIWDTNLKGFGLKVLPSGHKSYILKYRVGGGRTGTARKPTLGTHGKLTAEEARQVAKDWLADIVKGGDPAADRNAQREAMTFKDLADIYIEEYAKPNKRSWREDERILNKYCQPWHSTKASTIEPPAIAQLLATVKEVNGPAMANRTLSRIRRLYSWAVRNPLIREVTINPARDVDRPAPERARERVYTDKEIKALWKAFGEVGVQGVAYKLILATGQRLYEVIGLEWSEIDGDSWTLPGARTKNGRVHVVPLSDLALEIIEGQRGRHSHYVFPSPTGRDIPVFAATNNAKSVKSKSGVADFRSHDLRRTMATQSTALGFSRFLVDRLLNHTEPGVGGIYDRHDYLKEKTEIAAAWARRLRNIVEGGDVIQITHA
jgi:integrase